MKISVGVTVKNEEKTISSLLNALLKQSKLADEIVIVDGGSTDETMNIILKFKSTNHTNQTQNSKFKIIQQRGANIAAGRNLAVDIAPGEIIAMTDAGCIPDRDWLEKITQPFEIKSVNVIAGYYRMTAKSYFSQALKPFIGVIPERYDSESFLPSARSMAFRKSVWEKVGGFRENLSGAGEDTAFSHDLLNSGFKIIRVKDAIVTWPVPESWREAFQKFFNYAKGDAQTKIWLHSLENVTSHNIKIILIYIRHVLLITIICFFCFARLPLWAFVLILCSYLALPFFKFRDLKMPWQGRAQLPLIQIWCDWAVMSGFTAGIMKKNEK